MPFRQHMWKSIALLVGTFILTACGGGGEEAASADLPPMPPTATPVAPTPSPTPILTPTPHPEGEVLDPIENGQEVAPADDRYSIVIPTFWVQGTAPPADIAYRESGGTPTDRGFAYNVMREELPADISSAEEYAEAGREAVEERFADVETISMESVQVAGVQGVRWVYTTTIVREVVLVHQVYLVDGGAGFLLTGNAPADGDRSAAYDLFNSIAGSFSFPRG